MPKSRTFLIITLSIVLAVAYWIFSQGLGGGLYFDDMGNLAPLSQVRSFESAMQFVLSGTGGPSGRPLSMASFALQTEDWPSKPEAFIRVNILIHLMNGVLVAWLSVLLANRFAFAQKALFVTLLTAFWLLHPIQISSVLFIVQRMTLLAGFFTLLGLIFYLLGRAPNQGVKPVLPWIFLAFSMTIPAALSKENGILLPGFLLIMEFFLCNDKADSDRPNLRSRLLVVWGGAILLPGLLYLYRYWPSFSEAFTAKGYTPIQHVATELRAIVHYLSQIVMPNMPEFGPFHDEFPISNAWHDPRAILAASGLLGLAGLAWWIRHRQPLFTTGVFLFLWGHALESSVIPLEPYFEHRNYIPSLGIAMALVGLAATIRSRQKYILTGFVGLILLCAFSSHQYAAIWGQRNTSAQYWHAERPRSVRATLYLADHLGEQAKWEEANQLVSETWRANPDEMGLTMPMLYVTCRTSLGRIENTTFVDLTDSMKKGRFTGTSALILHNVLNLVASNQCPAFTLEDILTILDVLAANPHYQADVETIADFLIIRAKTLFALGNTIQSAALLNKAVEINFRLSIALQAAKLFSQLGNRTEATGLIELARSRLPANPWLRARWLSDIENMEATIAHYPNPKTI